MITLFSASNEDSSSEKLQKQDIESFTVIYEKYWYKLFTVAYNRLGDKETCEELVQDVFVKLWERKDSMDIRNLENYLVKSMKYKIIDHIRSQVTKKNYNHYFKCYTEVCECLTDNTVALNDLSTLLENGLEKLPEKSREVFKLSRLESWSISQIATHLGLSEKGVEYHLTKSLRTLRLYLREFAMALILAILCL